jgi:hypothetical protein
MEVDSSWTTPVLSQFRELLEHRYSQALVLVVVYCIKIFILFYFIFFFEAAG